MSSIKYIIGQYTRVNSFIRSRGCAALDRINEFTREYCPITYTYYDSFFDITSQCLKSIIFIIMIYNSPVKFQMASKDMIAELGTLIIVFVTLHRPPPTTVDFSMRLKLLV